MSTLQRILLVAIVSLLFIWLGTSFGLCILKVLGLWVLLTIISVNLVGYYVNAAVGSKLVHDQMEDSDVKDKLLNRGAGRLGVIFVAAAVYLVSVYLIYGWKLVLVAVGLMGLRLPDVLRELGAGDVPNYLSNIAILFVLLMPIAIWFSVC